MLDLYFLDSKTKKNVYKLLFVISLIYIIYLMFYKKVLNTVENMGNTDDESIKKQMIFKQNSRMKIIQVLDNYISLFFTFYPIKTRNYYDLKAISFLLILLKFTIEIFLSNDTGLKSIYNGFDSSSEYFINSLNSNRFFRYMFSFIIDIFIKNVYMKQIINMFLVKTKRFNDFINYLNKTTSDIYSGNKISLPKIDNLISNEILEQKKIVKIVLVVSFFICSTLYYKRINYNKKYNKNEQYLFISSLLVNSGTLLYIFNKKKSA